MKILRPSRLSRRHTRWLSNLVREIVVYGYAMRSKYGRNTAQLLEYEVIARADHADPWTAAPYARYRPTDFGLEFVSPELAALYRLRSP